MSKIVCYKNGHWKYSGIDVRYELVQSYCLHHVLRLGLFRSTLYLSAKGYSQQTVVSHALFYQKNE